MTVGPSRRQARQRPRNLRDRPARTPALLPTIPEDQYPSPDQAGRRPALAAEPAEPPRRVPSAPRPRAQRPPRQTWRAGTARRHQMTAVARHRKTGAGARAPTAQFCAGPRSFSVKATSPERAACWNMVWVPAARRPRTRWRKPTIRLPYWYGAPSECRATQPGRRNSIDARRLAASGRQGNAFVGWIERGASLHPSWRDRRRRHPSKRH